MKVLRKEYIFWDIDEVFVKFFVVELKENDVFFWLLLVIVKGVLMLKEFNKDKFNLYKLKVIGGNY